MRRMWTAGAAVSVCLALGGWPALAQEASGMPAPTAATHGPVTEVTGTGTCPTADLGTATTDPDGVQHFRDGTFVCTVTTDDPRVSGAETASWNIDLWGTAEDGALVQWGTSRLENAGGAWEGRGAGVYSSDRGDIIAFWYQGTGGYAGLGYFELWTGRDPWVIRGQVFPGDPPNPTGTPFVPVATGPAGPMASPAPLPPSIAHGPVTVVTGRADNTGASWGVTSAGPGGVSQARWGYILFAVTLDDPRVSGTSTQSPAALDLWAATVDWPGYGLQWFPMRLENAGGAWEGSGSGILDGRGDTVVAWCTGTGGYAGLSYFELWTSGDPFDLLTPGEPAWTIQGQIFPGDPPTP